VAAAPAGRIRDDGAVTDIPRKAFRRSLRLASLPAAHAGRTAVGLGRRLGGRPAELVAAEVQARTAAQLFGTLGELKGGAMKLGQALSAMEALLPAELAAPYGDALTRLQEAAPAMPLSLLEAVLVGDLGADWRERFAAFDEVPVAAASIGQVHRATWHDGTPVAVKTQYPGAADALTADIGQLDRVAPLARLGAPMVDVRQLFGQLRQRLVDELDYEAEAAAQRSFAEVFADDPDIVVPGVVEARPRVLVTEWIGGTPLAEVIRTGTASQRDGVGLRLLRLFLSSPERVGRIHGDPHPGNFRRLPDGRLAVLDFGSTEAVPAGWPPALGRLLATGRDRDGDTLLFEAVGAGLIRADAVDAPTLVSLLDPWLEPLRHERFHFDRPWLQREVRLWSNPTSTAARFQRKVRIPVHHLLVQRVGFGLLGVLTSLDATVEVRAEVECWVPGSG
jgi:predicted unusual protein kinase regulating ubiquinone biosynthesis (AarF/ABC1/UbiB family)